MNKMLLALFLAGLAVANAIPANMSLTLLVPPLFNASNEQLKKNFQLFPNYTTLTTGKLNSTEFEMYFLNTSNVELFSPWTSVPLALNETDGTAWGLIEIPRDTAAKMETKTSKKYNPIFQDTNEITDKATNTTFEVPRFYMYKTPLGNYGGFPQTWEDSEKPDKITQLKGDNDPVDFLDIGSAPAPVGTILRVKILGALGLLDKNETDWKIIVINTKDPNAAKWNDITDVPKAMKDDIYDWYLNYKIPEGKPATSFFPNVTDTDKLYYNKTAAIQIMKDRQMAYQRLLKNECQTEDCLDLEYPGKKEEKKEVVPTTGRRLRML